MTSKDKKEKRLSLKARLAITFLLLASIVSITQSFASAKEDGSKRGAEALYAHARKLYYGADGERYRRARAVELLEEASEQGAKDADALLASYYFYRDSGDKESDYGEACYLATSNLASLFDSRPTLFALALDNYILAEAHMKGRGFDQDEGIAGNIYREAFEGFQKVASTGDSIAMNYLAWCYYDGSGVEKDLTKAFEWWKKSAELGISTSMNSVGYCYEKGEGVEQDSSQAVEWYRKSAELGYPVAMCNLGWCYEVGEGVEKDPSQAVEWYRKSAELDNPRAMCNLGWCYRQGFGVEQDDDEAFEWFVKAVELGYARAMYLIGDSYYNGRGVEQDYSEAFEWFEEAAEAGDALGMAWLGCCYYDGRGVSQDRSKGVEWFEKAVETDPKANSGVQYLLGQSYRNGQGVPKDLDVALRWYKESAELGNEKAQEEYDRLKKIVESGGKLTLGEGEFDVESEDFLEGLRGVMQMN